MKPISLINISFFDKDKVISLEESTLITFRGERPFEDMQKHIEARRLYYSDLYQKDLQVDPDSIDTFTVDQAQTVLMRVCEFSGIDYTMAKSKMQDEEYVEARRFAINILKVRKMGNSAIARGLKLDHATVRYHIKQHANLSSVDDGYSKKYKNTYEYVMEKIGGLYSEDGSRKLKDND